MTKLLGFQPQPLRFRGGPLRGEVFTGQSTILRERLLVPRYAPDGVSWHVYSVERLGGWPVELCYCGVETPPGA